MIKMKLIIFYLIIIVVSNVLANVRVTGDRVSLRSAPSLDSSSGSARASERTMSRHFALVTLLCSAHRRGPSRA